MFNPLKSIGVLRHPGYNFGGGGGDTTTVQKADPWGPSQKYILQGLEQASKLFNQNPNGIKPYTGDQLANLPSWLSQGLTNTSQGALNSVPQYQQMMTDSLSGALNPQDTSYLSVGADNVTPGTVNAAQMGHASVEDSGLDPNAAINKILYGNAIDPWLKGQAQGMVDTTKQTFGDMSRSMKEQLQTQILPGIQDDFQAAGSLGASRQALLQGQAIGRTNAELARESGELNRNLSAQLANLYGTANENTQNRRASLSSQLAGLDAGERMAEGGFLQEALGNNAQFLQQAGLANLGANMQGQLANQSAGLTGDISNQRADLDASGLDFKNLMMQLQAGQMIPGIAQFPLSMSNAALGNYAPIMQEQQSGLDIAQNQYYEGQMAPWEQLMRATNVFNAGGGMGGTSTTTQPDNSNPLTGAMGGYALGTAGANALGAMSTGFGAAPFMAAMPWLGLLAGAFM